MTSYEGDPAAPAVVLFDKGILSHRYIETAGFMIEFERHTRIKIFKKEALHLANIVVPHHKDMEVGEIKASSFNLENGKMVETELEKANVFEESVTKNYLLTKFVIPTVKEGSIIEFTYTWKTQGGIGMPDEWVFQKEKIPTIWSEFEASVPAYIEFKKMSQGWVSFSLAEEGQSNETLNLKIRDRGAGLVVSTNIENINLEYTVNKMHFIQEDVPALKTEDYVNSPADYLSRISFDIQTVYDTDVVPSGPAYKIVNTLPTAYNRTWFVLGRELLDDVYEKDLESSKYTEEMAKACTVGKTTNPEILTAIYEQIGKNFVVKNDFDRIFKSQTMESLVKDRKGTPTDLNLLLINMLGKVGVEAWPVLISTTDHGQVLSYRVSLDEFNRVIAAVKTEDDSYILVDASVFPNPLGLLGKEDLGNQGLLLKSKEDVSWIPLQNKVSVKSVVIANMSLDATGNTVGSVVNYESGYNGVTNRKTIKEKGEAAMVQEQFKDWFDDGKLVELKVQNADNWNDPSLKIEFKLETAAFTNVSGDKIYLSPMAGLGLHNNPFKNPERKFNIDLDPNGEANYNLSFKIPEGYKVEELPKQAKVSFNENALSFEYLTENTAGVLKFNVRIKQKTSTIEAASYSELQRFYELMTAKMEEQAVLSKI